MRILKILSLFTLTALLLAACGPSVTPTSTTQPPVTITVSSTPSPAMMGDVDVVFTIVDAKGQPLLGATVDVFADHTGMSGMTMHGVATEQGNGKYAVRTNFNMAGKWKLSVGVKKDALDYQQDIDFEVK